jgi:hypothetical protein
MVYENHHGMGARWCTKTTEGQVRWCTETAIGRVGNGVRKLPIDGCVMVYGSRRWAVQDGTSLWSDNYRLFNISSDRTLHYG